TLAWTSDLKARWAVDWLKWPTFGRFIAQLVREHQKTDDTEIRPMEVRVEGDELVATLDAYDDAENFDNHLRSSLTVRHISGKPSSGSSDHSGEDNVVSFRHIAPGYYQARAPLNDFGTYALKAVHHSVTDSGERQPAGVSFGSVTRPYPEEISDLIPRPEALAKIAHIGGGKLSPSAAEVWDPGGDTV